MSSQSQSEPGAMKSSSNSFEESFVVLKRTAKSDAIRRAYRNIAFATFNTVIVLILVNLIMAGFFLVRDYRHSSAAAIDQRVQARIDKFADLQAYSRMSADTANRYLHEQAAMGSIGLQYQPWVQFGNPEFHGNFLNTDSSGFRKTREPQVSNEKRIKIYVFGGSTTFGYGVSDEHTIPSYLQAALERTYPSKSFLVRNFGQGFYYSSQEMLVLIRLLKEGDIPDFAVFIDGLNDVGNLALRGDEPWFTSTVRTLWARKREGVSTGIPREVAWIPMVRLANSLSATIREGDPDTTDDLKVAEGVPKGTVDYIVSRYENNMKITRSICREFGVKCDFVWQPQPGYKYDRSLHRNYPVKGFAPQYWRDVYSLLEGYKSEDFLYLGDMLEGVSYKVFVDEVHYNEVLNDQIATRICERFQLTK